MPSSDLSHLLLLAQRLFHDLVALLCVPSTRFGHLFPPAGSPAFLWPSYSHLSRVPNLMGRDTPNNSDSAPYKSLTTFFTVQTFTPNEIRERRRFANLEPPLNLVINPSHIPHIAHISKARRL